VSHSDDFLRGIWRDNPVLRLLLSMCPTLAVTTSAINGMGMGVCTMVVLLGSNVVVSVLRGVIPPKVRIPVFIVTIASFVTVVDMVMEGFANELHGALGLFIPLIVVNCIILGRAEAFASRHRVLPSLLDALGMGIGFTLALTLVGAIREVIGSGMLFGVRVFAESFEPVIVMVLAPGAFFTLGFILAGMNKMDTYFAAKKR
jgi:H+/Na+-translocating ferredoxin:NAD+ oxidoreductase subunit E